MGIIVTDFHHLFALLTCLKNPFKGMSLFRFVAVWTVAALACLKWMSPFWFVAVSICRCFDWFVAGMEKTMIFLNLIFCFFVLWFLWFLRCV